MQTEYVLAIERSIVGFCYNLPLGVKNHATVSLHHATFLG